MERRWWSQIGMGRRLLRCGASGGLRANHWNLHGAHAVRPLLKPSTFHQTDSWRPSAAGAHSSRSEIRNLSSRASERIEIEGPRNRRKPIAFSPDGRRLAIGTHDARIQIRDVDTLQVTQTITGHADRVSCIRYAPEGNLLATSSADKTIRLWRSDTGELKAVLSGHSGNVTSVAFSVDGRTLASAGIDNTVKLWSVESGQLTTTLRGHTRAVTVVEFSPRGNLLASAAEDGTVRLWLAGPTKRDHDSPAD